MASLSAVSAQVCPNSVATVASSLTLCSTDAQINPDGGLFQIIDASYKPITIKDNSTNIDYTYTPSLVLSPTQTTTYTIKFEKSPTESCHLTSNTVNIVKPPTLNIIKDNFSACNTLTISDSDIGASGNYSQLIYATTDGQTTSPFIFSTTSSIVITAKNPPCASFAEKTIRCTVNQKPSFSSTIVRNKLNTLNACKDCEIAYPSASAISVTSGSITNANIVWTNYNPVLASNVNPGISGKYTATIDSSNSCGTSSINIDTTVYMPLTVVNCAPTFAVNPSAISPCGTLDLYVRSSNEVNLLTAKINITANPTATINLKRKTAREVAYTSLIVEKTMFFNTIEYTQSCPNPSKPEQKHTATSPLRVVDIDTSVHTNYLYCPVDTAYITVYGTRYEHIDLVRVLPPHDDLFTVTSKDPYEYVLTSNNVVRDVSLYTPVDIEIVLNLINCNQKITRRKKIQIEEKNNCKPDLKVLYRDGISACAGDTINLEVSEHSTPYEIVSLDIPFDKYYRGDPIPTISESNVASWYKYNFYSYHCYPDPNPTNAIKRNIDFVLKYIFDGVEKDTIIKREVIVRSCPPILVANNPPYNGCPGDYNIFQIQSSNITTPKSEFKASWRSNPYRKVVENGIIQPNPPFTTHKTLKFKTFPVVGTNYTADITFYEGDSLRMVSENRYLNVSNNCFPPIISSKDTVCEGDAISFTFTLSSKIDAIVNSIDWDGSPSEPILKDKTGRTYIYDVQKVLNGTYVCNLNLLIDDSVITFPIYPRFEHRNVSDIRAFVTDTAYACINSQVHLNDYINKNNVKGDLIYGSDSVFTISGTSPVTVYAKAYAPFHCDFMNAVNQYEDTITIVPENSVYLNVMPQIANQDLCLGDSAILQVGSNGRLSWIKKWANPIQIDTIYKNIPGDAVVTDVVNGSASYEVIAITACAAAATKTINVTQLPQPSFIMIPELKACPYTDNITIGLSCTNCDLGLSKNILYNSKNSSFDTVANNHTMKILPQDTIYWLYYAVGNNGCKRTDSTRISAYPTPKISIDGNSNGDTVCIINESSITFTATGADSYKWLLPSPLNGASITINSKKDTIISVIGTEHTNYCIDTTSILCVVSLKTDLSNIGTDTSLCEHEDLCFSANNFPNTNYKWVHTKSEISNIIPAPSIYSICLNDITHADTGLYSLYINRLGCLDTMESKLSLYPTPNPHITSNSPICEGEDLLMQVNTGLPDSEAAFTSIDWTDPLNNTTSSTSFSIHSALVKDTGFYKVSVFNRNCNAIDSVHIDVRLEPNPSFTTVDPIYCTSSSDTLYISATGYDLIYTWYSDSRNDYTTTDTSFIIEWSYGDSTELYLSVDNGACSQTVSQFVNVKRTPVILDIDSYDASCLGEELRINSNSNYGTLHKWYIKQANGDSLFSEDINLIIDSASMEHSSSYYTVISNGPCSIVSQDILLTVHPNPIVKIDTGAFICEGTSTELTARSNDANIYLWNNGSSLPQTTITNQGKYIVTVESAYGCFGSDSIDVPLRLSPAFSLRSDTTLCNGESLILYGPQNMDEYIWSTGESSEDISITKNGLYSLSVIKDECWYSDSVNLFFKFCGRLHFPSAFTPNGNGLNDKWGCITSASAQELEFELYVFTRNGKIVFHTKDINENWDGYYKGEECMAGVYIFQCIAKEKENGTNLSVNGKVTIVK